MTEETTVVEVAPVRVYGVWRLYYVNPCLNCGKRHYHGGGDGPEPYLGSRGDHCSQTHRAWRPDCERIKNAGNERVCSVQHVRDAVRLVLAAPEVVANFAQRYRTNKVVVGRQDRKGAMAHLQSLA
jgi:hypothetical protein